MTRTLLLALACAAGLATALYAPAIAASDRPAVTAASADAAPVAAPAPAAQPADDAPAIDPIGWSTDLYQAVRSGRWTMVVGLILIGATYVTRRYVLASWDWAQTDRGGVALAGLLALAGAFANASMAGEWMDGRALLAALEVALVAMGGYAGLRKLVWPSDPPKEPAPEELLT